MAGLLDFLFNGNPPPNTTTGTSSTVSMPQWMNDYTTALLSKANQQAATGYQPYEGARIASFTPTQKAAFDLAKSNIGKANPGIEAALGIAGNLPGQGALTQAMNYLPTSLEEFPDAAERYMNPYQDNVINRSKDLAMRTYNEDLLPGLEGMFARSGNFGSSAHARAVGNTQRDVIQNIQDTSNAQLAEGWNTSANIFNQDQSRAGQLAQIAGQIGSTQGQLGLDTAGTLANLSKALQSAGASDAATLEAIGQQEQGQNQKNLDLAHNDFLQQQNYSKEQIEWLNSLLTGNAASAPQTTTSTTTGPASSYQPSGLSQIASILAAWKGISGNGE